MLTLQIINATEQGDVCDYNWILYKNRDVLRTGVVKQHRRTDGWPALLRLIADVAEGRPTAIKFDPALASPVWGEKVTPEPSEQWSARRFIEPKFCGAIRARAGGPIEICTLLRADAGHQHEYSDYEMVMKRTFPAAMRCGCPGYHKHSGRTGYCLEQGCQGCKGLKRKPR